MITYKTQNSEYPVEIIDGEAHIRALKGPHKGQPYRILGFYNPEKDKMTYFPSGRILFNDEPCHIENLPDYLNKEAKLESRIVAAFFLEGHLSLDKLMVTSSIKEIKETEEKEEIKD